MGLPAQVCQASRSQLQKLSQGVLGMDSDEASLLSELLTDLQEPEIKCAAFLP